MIKINKIRKICIITSRYPTEKDPASTFVDKLVCEMADQGVDCTVISPTSLSGNIIRNIEKLPKYRERITKENNIIKIYHPKYISCSNKNILGLNTGQLTLKNFEVAVMNTINKIDCKFDAIYSHFIMPSGLTASKISKIKNIPSFLAYGECSIDQFDFIGLDKVRDRLKNIKGVVSVSSANKEVLIENKLIEDEKIEVFPNAINQEIFYKRDKAKMREKFGFNTNDFIVSFVGYFIDRKGPLRVLEALKEEDVKFIFIGSGPQIPKNEKVLFCDRVEPHKIPELLSASDVFVLPTLAEGCCNAIIEAMACGLPIVSSNLPFNRDILNSKNSIMIDPRSLNEIRDAINLLKENIDLRVNMGNESLKISENLSIQNRARNIIDFMEKNI